MIIRRNRKFPELRIAFVNKYYLFNMKNQTRFCILCSSLYLWWTYILKCPNYGLAALLQKTITLLRSRIRLGSEFCLSVSELKKIIFLELTTMYSFFQPCRLNNKNKFILQILFFSYAKRELIILGWKLIFFLRYLHKFSIFEDFLYFYFAVRVCSYHESNK